MNTTGYLLRLTILGESHGEVVGAVLDGLPAGMAVDLQAVQSELEMRMPAPLIGTARREEDRLQVRSGLKDGILTGTPVLMILENRDVRSASYRETERIPRPGHADYTSFVKYHGFADHRGGGQFSGRLTAPMVAAGALARQYLKGKGIRVAAHVTRISDVTDDREYSFDALEKGRFSNEIRCIDPDTAGRMRERILDARGRGDSVGGVVHCRATGIPPGLGEPFFDTVEGELSRMLFAIPAVKGVEFGSGFASATMYGSENNDPFIISPSSPNGIATSSNHAGGVNGGLTNGMDIEFNVAVKPTSSISRTQQSVDLESMTPRELSVKGRHDPCIVPRAVVVVEAACSLVLADLHLRSCFS